MFPGHTTRGMLREVQKMMEEELRIKPKDFKDRIVFMSMSNEIDRNRQGNDEVCNYNSSRVSEYARRFLKRHWSFLGRGEQMECYTCTSAAWIMRKSRRRDDGYVGRGLGIQYSMEQSPCVQRTAEKEWRRQDFDTFQRGT